MTNLVP